MRWQRIICHPSLWKTMEIGYVKKLKSGYALRIELPEVRYYEVGSFEELIKILRKEFDEELDCKYDVLEGL